MWSKNILNNQARFATVFACIVVTCMAFACGGPPPLSAPEPLEINVIYPKDGDTIAAFDSTFIHGSIPSFGNAARYHLRINDVPVEVHDDGGFIGFVPVTPGLFVFHLKVYRAIDYPRSHRADTQDRVISATLNPPIQPLLSDSTTVFIREPRKTITLADSLIITGEYRAPRGDIFVPDGERLDFSFHGTSGCRAWMTISGVVDSLPMIETEPRLQPYWGESVFGAGEVPDSLKLGGIYSAYWIVPKTVQAESLTVRYYLAPPLAIDIFDIVGLPPYTEDTARIASFMDPQKSVPAIRSASYKIAINSDQYPFTVRFTDSMQIIRHDPRMGYFSIFQPNGVEALAVGAEGGWYKLKLSATQYAWAAAKSVDRLPKGIAPPHSYLAAVRTESGPNATTIRFPLSGRHPFRIIEDDKRTLRVLLYGVTSNTDWIRYDAADELIDIATWSQVEENLYELKIKLTKDIWGYDTYYEGNTFFLELIKPPTNTRSLKGKRIVIDPGHSSDRGAVGPTGLTEAEANLGVALALQKELSDRGAVVIMTRDDMSHVALYDRPSIAKANDADLFVSIHNNALPDGINPFVNNGSSCYYYHPHSIDLARAIHKELVKATGLRDFGLYHGNLAVNRPTQYPAVLIECAFMILPEQEAMLKTDKFRKKVADGIADGIENFLKDFNHD